MCIRICSESQRAKTIYFHSGWNSYTSNYSELQCISETWEQIPTLFIKWHQQDLKKTSLI